MKIKARICAFSNGKKITAIKAIRTVFGLGLVEAKNFVENCDFRGEGVYVIMTASQFGHFVTIAMTDCRGFESEPSFLYSSPSVIGDNDMLDFSGNP